MPSRKTCVEAARGGNHHLHMIELRHVSRSYGGSVNALDDVSLKVSESEFVAITGPSGCGKSTLLHLVGGLDAADRGELFVDGLPLHKAGDAELTRFRRTIVGVVFQFFHLLPTMTVFENVQLPLLLAGASAATAAEKARGLIENVGLSPRARHFPHQRSGGEMQRTAIARALVHEPKVLLADEPTGNLDSASAAQVLALFQKIASQRKITLLLVTHSDEVARISSRRVELRDGRIVEDHQQS